MLYLSLYFKQNRLEYYRLLDEVWQEGDWESWVVFFLEGVAQTADSAVTTARRLSVLFDEDRTRVRQEGRRAGSALRVHDALRARPLITLQQVAKRTHLSFPAATAGMRVFVYDRYLALLSEGTEVP